MHAASEALAAPAGQGADRLIRLGHAEHRAMLGDGDWQAAQRAVIEACRHAGSRDLEDAARLLLSSPRFTEADEIATSRILDELCRRSPEARGAIRGRLAGMPW